MQVPGLPRLLQSKLQASLNNLMIPYLKGLGLQLSSREALGLILTQTNTYQHKVDLRSLRRCLPSRFREKMPRGTGLLTQ